MWTMIRRRTQTPATFITFILIIISILGGSCSERNTESISSLLQKAESFNPLSGPKQSVNSTDTSKAGFLQIIEGIYLGIELAVKECKTQFQWERWNCPISPVTSIISKTAHYEANREIAFMQAISAAGIMYYVTKRCHRGVDNENICGCHRYSLEDGGFYPGVVQWKWRGCNSQNVKFGEKVSRMFLKTKSNTRNTLQALKSHNERAGNKAVLDTMRVVCKCHGVTGSCTTRTCWKQLQGFREIGKLLKRKYRRSKDLRRFQGQMKSSNRVRRRRISRISRKGLIYIVDSPNYCEADNSLGFLGTIGRECKRRMKGQKDAIRGRAKTSCQRLCTDCGLKIKQTVKEEAGECCQFQWCCKVECKPCFKNVTRFYCKGGKKLNRKPDFNLVSNRSG